MFGNSKQAKRNAGIDSLVGSQTTIKGDIHFNGGLHVDGVIQGNVAAEADSEDSMLTTSENCRIEGNVKVHRIVLNGEVIGDVHALEHVELAANARVTGNVYYKVIEMMMGAEVNGSLIHVLEGGKIPKPTQMQVSASPTSSAPPTSNEKQAVDEPVQAKLSNVVGDK
jgi:cytoskeletal protein CcmA (bactofilin family)